MGKQMKIIKPEKKAQSAEDRCKNQKFHGVKRRLVLIKACAF